MSTICKCQGSSLVFTHSEKWSFTYHERDAECEVPWGANEVGHFAVHPAHDVHVDCAALQTSSRELEMYIYRYWYTESRYRLNIPTSRAMLSWRPNTRFSSLPLNQLTAYVFWATAKDSPPMLFMHGNMRGGWVQKGKKKPSKIKFYYCVTSYPKTKRPTSHSQNRFTKAPVAKMTLVGLRGGEGKRVIFIYSHIVIPRTLIKVNSPVRHRQRGKR